MAEVLTARTPEPQRRGGKDAPETCKPRPKLVKPAPPPLPDPLPPVTAPRRSLGGLGILLSFVLIVLAPAGAAAWYLWTQAADQYASHTGFSVRKEAAAPQVEVFAGLGNLGGEGSSDADVLYAYLQSQELVALLDAQLDLKSIWSRPGAGADPFFTFVPDGTIEELTDYWSRMIRVEFDTTTGLLDVRTLAFDPQDARRVARAIFAAASEKINAITAVAQEDTLRHARADVQDAAQRLKEARLAMTAFRNRTQIVDPASSLASQMGLLSSLQQQQAAALVRHDLLISTTRDDDPRLAQARRELSVIEARIAEEQSKLGLGEGAARGAVYADLMGEFESLAVDRTFAEEAYVAALAGLDLARAEARRQSRYLAAHVAPTLAESAVHPKRMMLFTTLLVLAVLGWGLAVLVFKSLTDRR